MFRSELSGYLKSDADVAPSESAREYWHEKYLTACTQLGVALFEGGAFAAADAIAFLGLYYPSMTLTDEQAESVLVYLDQIEQMDEINTWTGREIRASEKTIDLFKARIGLLSELIAVSLEPIGQSITDKPVLELTEGLFDLTCKAVDEFKNHWPQAIKCKFNAEEHATRHIMHRLHSTPTGIDGVDWMNEFLAHLKHGDTVEQHRFQKSFLNSKYSRFR